jgi:cell volume regulation protein A
MHLTLEVTLVSAAVLLILSVLASKLSDRFGIPVLLIFIGIGMLAGSEGLGGIYFDNAGLAQAVGIVALIVILFSGGLDTDWGKMVPIVLPGLALATLGVVITAGVMGVAAHLVLGITLIEGILLGAIVSSTDAAAVFSILRSSGVRLKGRLTEILEFESGSNDPMAVFLTIGLIQLVQNPGQSALSLLPLFLQQMLIGGAAGFLAARLLRLLVRRIRLGYEGLYPVLVLGVIFLTYGVTTLLGGSGFLAVYLGGLLLCKEELFQKESMHRFFDSLAWLAQIAMFLTLGLLVFPSQLLPILLPGFLLALILIFIARPLAVGISLSFARIKLAEKGFISWVGLRGAVPIILATYPVLAGLKQAGLIFNVVFFVVLTSVLIQGTTLPMVARWLRVEETASAQAQKAFETEGAEDAQ